MASYILNQQLEDIEILVINDGSTDTSLEALNKYKHLKNVKIINQTNKGVVARNIAINHTIGEYIGFMNVDDEINSELYKSLFTLAKEKDYDIVYYGYFESNKGNKVSYSLPLI